MGQKRNSSSTWAVVVLILGISVLIIAAIVRGGGEPVIIGGISPGDNVGGNPASTVVLVEYGDYQCPACAAYDPIVRELASEFGDRIAVVYRHFPLRTIHKNADLAARAAEAAGVQGKFWEMHQALYQTQRQWKDSNEAANMFANIAVGFGLDRERFMADIDSSAVRTKVDSDALGGTRAGINGTPTFFLNGKRIEPASYEDFRALIEEALRSST
jgi:protein-disulfide isomerase